MMTLSKPKICLVVATPLTIHFFLKPLVIALAEHFDVSLIYNPKNDAYLPRLDLPARHFYVGIMRKMSPLHDAATLVRLVRLFRRERFDLVVSFVPKAGLLGMVAAWAARVACRLHIFQGEVWAARGGVMRAVLKMADMITARAATYVLAVSESERAFLSAQGVIDSKRGHVLGPGSISGVDVVRFRPDSAARLAIRRSLAIPDEAIVCIFMGRLSIDKGVFELVQAFNKCAAENKDLWLLLVGPDEEGVGGELRAGLTPEASSRTRIEGFSNQPERYLAASDFLCLPSYREAFGMVILEAAAMGIPSIGSRIYGISDAIIEQETGLLVSPRDVQALAKAMLCLSADSARRSRYGEAGRLRVLEKFKQDTIVGGYVDYMRNLIKK